MNFFNSQNPYGNSLFQQIQRASVPTQSNPFMTQYGLSPVNIQQPAPQAPNYAMTTGNADDPGRTRVMVSTPASTPTVRSGGSGGGAGSGSASSLTSSLSSSVTSGAPSATTSSRVPVQYTLGVPDDPRINEAIARVSGFADMSPNSLQARVAALMAPQEAMAQRQIDSGVTRALSAQGILPTGGLAEKMRSDISAPIMGQLALARVDAMDRYTNQGLDANRSLLQTLTALQEAQRNQKLNEAELDIRREDLGLRRDEAQRQAERDRLQNQSLQQQIEMARLAYQQAANPYRPDQVNYLNASAPGGLQSGSGGSAGSGGAQMIGGFPVSGPASSSAIVNQNDARAAAAYAGMTNEPTPSALGAAQAAERQGNGWGNAASSLSGLVPQRAQLGFNPNNPFGDATSAGGSIMLDGGFGFRASDQFNPNLASQGIGAGGSYNAGDYARSAADMAYQAAIGRY